jgi:hypothetical protein
LQLTWWQGDEQTTVEISVKNLYRQFVAAEIRAIADWLVPEEPMIVEGGRTYEQAWLVSERERLRLRLLAETDRADRAEKSNG